MQINIRQIDANFDLLMHEVWVGVIVGLVGRVGGSEIQLQHLGWK